MSGLYTIPPHLCFVTCLAQGLWARVKGDPLALASYTVYLPTRRSCRALRDAFLRVTGGQGALLPRMQPLGDSDDFASVFAEGPLPETLPPAIPALRRQLLLTQFVAKKEPDLPLDQAAELAASLADLIDQTQSEGLDWTGLDALAPEKYAQHWQETLKFLEIATKVWPALLEKEGCLDPAARRDAALDLQIQNWQQQPPQAPIIAAGSTGSVPGVGRFLAAVAQLPLGEVVLPGLDLALDEEAWQAIDETHPQATMKHWLEQTAHLSRGEVTLWENVAAADRSRTRLLREALVPAAVSERWQNLKPEAMPLEATQGLERLDLASAREEADAIALRLRAALEDEGKTAALVTPDRALASRVASALARWGIIADDSAGAPLTQCPVGSFLVALLQAAASDASPVAFLSLLKHPLAAAGDTPEVCRAQARAVECQVWRGVRLVGGFAGAARAMVQTDQKLEAWLRRLDEAFAPLTGAWSSARPFEDWIRDHLRVAEALAASDRATGAERLWRADDGQTAVAWFDELRAACVGFPALDGEAYARLVTKLLQGVPVRPAYGVHPRLSLLGPLEARLLHHDLVILGGLNEGTWPPAPAVDPWLSRPMKADFGLPSPERRVGLSAHDFAQLASGPSVLLTRARRAGGADTVPSRFLLQLETVLRALGREEALTPSQPWKAWAQALDSGAAYLPMAKPEPVPPLSCRPRRLSVTEIGTWLCNPYAIYAKHILKLKKLDPIDADVSAADHGTAIHAALESFIKQTKTSWPSDPLALLLEEGRKAFAPFENRPQVKAFWGARFERIAAWFIEKEEARRAAGIKPLAVEAEGRGALADGAFTLRGRADRIDLGPDGRVQIIDYKTGAPPTEKKVLAGYEPQLALLAMLAKEGGFAELGVRYDTFALSYWKMQGGDPAGEERIFEKDLAVLVGKAREGLEALIARFADPRTPYRAVPRPAFAPSYDDYEHLARMDEWGPKRKKRK